MTVIHGQQRSYRDNIEERLRMSRCKACDTILTEFELKKVDRLTGLHLDLCGRCNKISDDAISDDWVTYSGEDDIMFDSVRVIQQEVLQ